MMPYKWEYYLYDKCTIDEICVINYSTCLFSTKEDCIRDALKNEPEINKKYYRLILSVNLHGNKSERLKQCAYQARNYCSCSNLQSSECGSERPSMDYDYCKHSRPCGNQYCRNCANFCHCFGRESEDYDYSVQRESKRFHLPSKIRPYDHCTVNALD